MPVTPDPWNGRWRGEAHAELTRLSNVLFDVIADRGAAALAESDTSDFDETWAEPYYQRVISVGGHMKSGTTLLIGLLDDHPDLLVLPGDSHIFSRMAEFNTMAFEEFARYWIGRLLNPTGQAPFWCFATKRSIDAYVDLFATMAHFKSKGHENVFALVAALGRRHRARYGELPTR